MLTGIQLGAPQDLEHLWEECQAPLQVSRVLVVEAPLFTSTHKLLPWFVDTCWTHSSS